MATMPMTQPSNPNQAAGATLSPMTYGNTGGVLGATVPMTPKPDSKMVTGTGADTAGQPFGTPTSQFGTVPVGNVSGPFSSGGTMPSISSGLDIKDGEKTVTGDFKDVFGAGTGKAITGILGDLGTAENAAYKATAANALMTANDQYSNMLAQEAARGISPDSSSHALATGDFMAKVNSNLTDVGAKMQLGGLDTILNTLTGEGQLHGKDESGWDTFGDVLNMGAGIANTLFTGGSGSAASGIGGTLGKLFGGGAKKAVSNVANAGTGGSGGFFFG